MVTGGWLSLFGSSGQPPVVVLCLLWFIAWVQISVWALVQLTSVWPWTAWRILRPKRSWRRCCSRWPTASHRLTVKVRVTHSAVWRFILWMKVYPRITQTESRWSVSLLTVNVMNCRCVLVHQSSEKHPEEKHRYVFKALHKSLCIWGNSEGVVVICNLSFDLSESRFGLQSFHCLNFVKGHHHLTQQCYRNSF